MLVKFDHFPQIGVEKKIFATTPQIYIWYGVCTYTNLPLEIKYM